MNYNVALLLSCLIFLITCESSSIKEPKRIKVAVIGAGVAGLTSIKNIIKDIPHAEVKGFEIKNEIGGTWIYEEDVNEENKYYVSALYKSLRTNLPKQIMELTDFPIPPYYKAFMPNEDYLKYLRNYVKHFGLKKYIKFRHQVLLVKPKQEKWDVSYKNLINNKTSTEEFDFVMVCNGHFTNETIVKYKGHDIFKGFQIHSRFYRVPQPYTNKTVLIIGSGPSGLDISIELAKYAKKVFLSHPYSPYKSPFPSNYIQKPQTAEFGENYVKFKDGSVEKIDGVIYCTGYRYDYPFLDSSSGLESHKTHVAPLYQHVVNVEHPTMFLIGVPHLCCAVPMAENQVKYAVSLMKGNFKLPSKEKMLAHIKEDYDKKDKSMMPLPTIAVHHLGEYEVMYFEELAKEAGIKQLPPVFAAIRFSTMQSKKNLYIYREYDYHIKDNDNFYRSFEGVEGADADIKDPGTCRLEKFHTKPNNETKRSYLMTKLVCENDVL